MARALAHVEVIKEIKPVFLVETDEPAENIEIAVVLGWEVVVKKNEFKVGDFAVYIETDSVVPIDNPEFAFLEKKNYKVKAMKLNKFYSGFNKTSRVISQGILFPCAILGKNSYKEGQDVTAALNITKLEDETKEPQINIDNTIKRLASKHWFLKTRLGQFLLKYHWFRNFVKARLLPYFRTKKYPTYIVKTDENRIQNLPEVFTKYQGIALQATEKLDGTSTSFGLEKINSKKFDFAVCSRNVRQLDRNQKTWYIDAGTNFYWEMAEKYNIEKVLKQIFVHENVNSTLYLQGETIGPAIQGNKYKLDQRDFYAFNLVIDGRKVNSLEAKALLEKYNIKWVPILDTTFYLPETIKELEQYANASSTLYDTLREGVVIRDAANSTSFKVISPEFLIKHNL